MRKTPILTSLAIHSGAIGLILLLASIPSVRSSISRMPDRVVPLLAPRLTRAKAQGGGGQRNPLPASRGQVPPRPVTRVFVPPMAVRLENPKLTVQQAMIEAPDFNIQAPDIGDPLRRIGPLSGGSGGPFGIGDGTGFGIGKGLGNGNSIVSYKSLGITEQPQLLHSEEPEYSEEGRKARAQGSVLLAIDVGMNGRVANIRVVKSLGLGLDEKAKEAVLKWRFRPAMAGGRPVTAPAQVTVTFHLL
ncbi:MAG TPA: energy transducer TonB [Bryobacteraceae bacterium]|jgi:protein TonB|nr:energy transducer TonB [Bryobacteraceae bacterium]